MKIFPLIALLASLLLASPLAAADSAQTVKPAEAEAAKPAGDAAPQAPGEYVCKYYTAKLPAGWKAIVPPEEQQGNINAIFATDMGNLVVTLVGGPSGGQDAQSLAKIFSEQFKAKKEPVESNNGLYTFQFPVLNTTATAYVASYDGNFMLTTIAGGARQGLKFIRDNIKSDTWPGLLPQW